VKMCQECLIFGSVTGNWCLKNAETRVLVINIRKESSGVAIEKVDFHRSPVEGRRQMSCKR
jgi:hypothetical protein